MTITRIKLMDSLLEFFGSLFYFGVYFIAFACIVERNCKSGRLGICHKGFQPLTEPLNYRPEFKIIGSCMSVNILFGIKQIVGEVLELSYFVIPKTGRSCGLNENQLKRNILPLKFL